MPITIKNSAGGGVTLDSTTSNNETVNLPTGGGTLLLTNGDGSALTGTIPAGAEIMWASPTLPTGWLEENGASISRSTYAALFAVIGVTYGSASSTTFNLPDARGEFIRGWAHGSANDPGRAARTNRGDGTTGDVVGSKQLDQFQGHKFSVRGNNNSGSGSDQNVIVHIAGSALNNLNSLTTGANSDGTNGTPRTGLETRARNTNRMIIIKF